MMNSVKNKNTLRTHYVIHQEKKKGEENEIVSESLPMFQGMKKEVRKTFKWNLTDLQNVKSICDMS